MKTIILFFVCSLSLSINSFCQSDSLFHATLIEKIKKIEQENIVLKNALSQQDIEIRKKDSDMASLNQSIKEKESVIKNLGEYLANCKATIPTSITFVDKRITDTKAIFNLKTNFSGFLKATLKGNNFSKTLDPTLGELHSLVFDGLSPNSDYKLEVVVLDYSKNETNTKKSADGGEERFAIKTLLPMTKPSTTIKFQNITHNEITLSLNSFEQSVLWSVEALVGGTNTVINKVMFKKGNFEIDSYNLPIPSKITQMEKLNDYNVTFSNLNPETAYYFRVKTVNEAGYLYDSELYTISTKQTPVALDFDDSAALELIYGPLETKFKWKVKGKLKKATVKVYLASDPKSNWEQTTESVSKDNIVELTIPFVKVQELLSKVSESKEVPIAEISMTDENGREKKINVKTQFVIPSEADINKKVVNDAQKKEILEASSKIKSKNKIKWEDIVHIGLPVILSFL